MTTTPTDLAPAKRKGPRILTSIAVFVLGLIVLGTGIWQFVSGFVDLFDSTRYAVPGVVRVHLDDGTQQIYERSDGFDRVTIRADQVTVTAPNGSDVPVRSASLNETITEGSGRYVAAVRFTTHASGRYTVRVESTQPAEVLVAPSLGTVFSRHAIWLVAIVGGGLMAIAGIVMFIVGIVRRSRAAKTQVAYAGAAPYPGAATYAGITPYAGVPPASTPTAAPVAVPTAVPTATTTPTPTPAESGEPASPLGSPPEPVAAQPVMAPAGWFPDPHGQRRLRYWDGSIWTEHTAD